MTLVIDERFCLKMPNVDSVLIWLSLCNHCALSASVVRNTAEDFTTEALRAQRLHRV